MSRIEKYRAYRDKIRDKNSITNVLNNPSPKVKEFKKTINEINSKILWSYKPVSINLFEFLSSDISVRDNTFFIQNLLSDLNFNELMIMKDQANLLFLSIKNNKSNLEFEEGWLNNDQGIEKISWCNKTFNEVQKENLKFDNKSLASYNNFLNTIHTAQKSIDSLKSKEIGKIFIFKNNKLKHLLFCSSIGLFAISLISCLIALIVMVSG
ncbi:hypothetical protein [Mycoplasmoides alvi]|uniref:hypothetical protein n=1 Tax=Mycoplasmoides alvi TaxID=78580 RepID=UPI00051AF920|nr:hypothetical protein [Mycoplasmoides alvi]